jgi:hypothetical protein
MVRGEHGRVPTSLQGTRPPLSIRRPTVRQLFLLLPLALAACDAPAMTDARPMAPSASAALSSSGGFVHSVTGSGVQDLAPGFKAAIEISIHQDASGNVSGQIYGRAIDLSIFGLDPSQIWEEPTCMRVVGNTAYIGAVVTKATDPATFPVGQPQIFWVRDGGPNGVDVGHFGPSWGFDPAGLICSATPPIGNLPPDLFTEGNIVVR